MTVRVKGLLWAAIIIVAALICVGMQVGDGASFGIIAGLSGAAWGSLNSEASCARSCLQ